MIKRILTTLFFVVIGFATLFGQADDKRLEEIKDNLKSKEGQVWTTGAAIGLDLSQLALINPAVGSGQNKLAFGGITSFFGNYKKDKVVWDNLVSWQIAAQRLGSSDNPFTKSVDVLRFDTKAGYEVMEKTYVALLGTFESQMLKTYNDNSLSETETNSVISALFAPATITLSPGIDYKKNDNLSMFFSPASYKGIFVMNDDIASLGNDGKSLHGNPWRSATDFDKIKTELGANFRAVYANKYFNDKLVVSSNLSLYYDYLGENHGFEYIDMTWINNFGYEIFKGLSLNLLLDIRWDKDIQSITGYDDAGAPSEYADNKFIIKEALFVKYTRYF